MVSSELVLAFTAEMMSEGLSKAFLQPAEQFVRARVFRRSS